MHKEMLLSLKLNISRCLLLLLLLLLVHNNPIKQFQIKRTFFFLFRGEQTNRAKMFVLFTVRRRSRCCFCFCCRSHFDEEYLLQTLRQ